MQLLPHKPKIIAIVGPTASGKSDLAVRLAKRFNGEVVSADSRQVFRGMDIGTGKMTRDEVARHPEAQPKDPHKAKSYFHKGIRHHLIDVASPKRDFSVVRYQKLARAAIQDILRRGKLPILCGGTGLYIDAVLHNAAFPQVKADKKLRAQLEKRSANDLFRELEKLDPTRTKTIDRHNKRRLIRALEIFHATGTPLRYTGVPKWRDRSHYELLKLGVAADPAALRRRIVRRLIERLKHGMIKEVIHLHEEEKLSWKRLQSFGLEYRYISLFLQNKLPPDCYREKPPIHTKVRKYQQEDMDALVVCLSQKIWQYAKRQMTWFKRDSKILWIQNQTQAVNLTRAFLKGTRRSP